MISSIASGEWLLSSNRLCVYPRIFLSLYFIAIVVYVVMSNGNVDMNDRPLGTDFVSFYAASQLVQDGNAPLAYNVSTHFAAEKIAVANDAISYYSFSYPPMILLLLMPLASLPYLVALLLWQGLTLIFFVLMIKKFSGGKDVLILILASPVVFLTLLHGQNSIFPLPWTTILLSALLYQTIMIARETPIKTSHADTVMSP